MLVVVVVSLAVGAARGLLAAAADAAVSAMPRAATVVSGSDGLPVPLRVIPHDGSDSGGEGCMILCATF